MRRRTLLSLILTAALALAACGDDDGETTGGNGGNGGNNSADTGTDTGQDAGDTGGTDTGGTDTGGTDTGGTDTGGDAGTTGASITADDQFVAAADSQMVIIASATSDGPGWAVIHEDDGSGNVGDVLGQAALTDGENTDIDVTLSRDVVDGETLYAMLHVDAGEEGTYEFPGADVPAQDDAGNTIVDPFAITTPSVDVADQTPELSTLLTIDRVVSGGAGWLVIHANACTDDQGNATFGDVLGHAALTDGENLDVEVGIARPATDGESFCAMLHTDAPADGEYTFGTDSDDPPVANASDIVVMESFAVTVAEGTPAVRITLSANATSDYTVDDVEPDLHAMGMEGQNDPILKLMSDWRYEVVNTASSAHPFEFIGTAGSVQASQSDDANLVPMEALSNVNWDEIDDQTFRFTTSPAFQSAVDGYQCRAHPNTMTGLVEFQ